MLKCSSKSSNFRLNCKKLYLMHIIIRTILVSFLFLVVQGCEYFNTTTITPAQVKEQSNWSEKDAAPSFEDCDGLEGEENLDCFKNLVGENISFALNQYSFNSIEIIDEEIIISIEIDAEGNFSLTDIQDKNDVISKVESLYSDLEDIILNLPTALPAVKTNVGVKVKTQLKLPIRIISSPGE